MRGEPLEIFGILGLATAACFWCHYRPRWRPVDDSPAAANADLATHPNDAFFKSVFSEPAHAVAFFQSHLPAAMAGRIDWTTLELVPTSFVKSTLQQVHSDLIFSVRIGERETLLYLLFEHQSTVDPAMPLRLLGYLAEILMQHHREHGLPLPPVIPFVFHQGPETWQVSTAFESLFRLPAELADDLLPYLPKFNHALLDLTRCDPATEEADLRLRIVLQLMKLARERELARFFEWLCQLVLDGVSDRLLDNVLVYALHADTSLDIREIHRTLPANNKLKSRAMSIAEQIKAEGRTEGISQGISQGRWVGRIQILEEFLGKPPTPTAGLETLPIAELEARHQQLHREYEIRFKGR